MYELSNFDHVLIVESQSRVTGVNRTRDPHANSLAHCPLDYRRTHAVTLSTDRTVYTSLVLNSLNQV